MPYHRCPECGLTVQSTAGRFVARSCPRCSVPLEGTDQISPREPAPAAISRRFRAEPRAAHAARRALETLRRELDGAQFHTAALLTTELVANAVQHADRGSDGEVRLEAALIDDHIRISVGDDGSGFVPVARAPGEPIDCHGGLHRIDALADRWGVVAEPQTLVWFELERAVSTQTTGTVATRHETSATY